MYNLFLDDERTPMSTYSYFPNNVYIDKEWVIVRNHEDFVKTIEKRGLPSIISFDHDLGYEHYPKSKVDMYKEIDYSNFKEKTGYDSAKWLVNYLIDNNLELPKIYIHTQNPVGRENIKKLLDNFLNKK